MDGACLDKERDGDKLKGEESRARADEFIAKELLKNHTCKRVGAQIFEFDVPQPASPMAATSTSDAVDWDSDDFELINDDGFVYKRKKRRHGLPSLARPPDPTPDPELEEKQRRERKRKALLKVREKYEREIGLWEQMSNTLRATEQSVKEKQKQDTQGFEQKKKKQQEGGEGGESSAVGKQGDCGSLIDELLLQVEAQEAIIHQVTNLCDVAEALCDGQEQKMNQSFIDLPIWGSPRELMALLCDD